MIDHLFEPWLPARERRDKVHGVSRLLVVLSVLVVSGCRVHTLEDGAYAFTKGEVLRDDCGLANQPEVFTKGTLLKAGHMVRLSYGYLGAELAGTYRYGLEEFTADATITNTRATLRGQDCQLDTVQLGIDATTQSAQRFTGTLSFVFQSRASDACTCRLMTRFDAQRSP